jgi:hypothetical protein
MKKPFPRILPRNVLRMRRATQKLERSDCTLSYSSETCALDGVIGYGLGDIFTIVDVFF